MILRKRNTKSSTKFNSSQQGAGNSIKQKALKTGDFREAQ